MPLADAGSVAEQGKLRGSRIVLSSATLASVGRHAISMTTELALDGAILKLADRFCGGAARHCFRPLNPLRCTPYAVLAGRTRSQECRTKPA